MDFLKTFLLTYQSFTTPTILFEKLHQRYHVPRRRIGQDLVFQEFEKLRLKIQLRVCNVLQQWTKKYVSDFVGSSQAGISKSKRALLTRLLHFAESTIVVDHPTLGRQIRRNVLKLVHFLL
jgi:hypothetical protein